MNETYKAQGECTNCGRENYPKWGEYDKGKQISDYPCPQCGCMTWRPRGKYCPSPDVGETNETVKGRYETGLPEYPRE